MICFGHSIRTFTRAQIKIYRMGNFKLSSHTFCLIYGLEIRVSIYDYFVLIFTLVYVTEIKRLKRKEDRKKKRQEKNERRQQSWLQKTSSKV